MKKKPTKAESLHLGRVAALGCIVCSNEGYPGTPAIPHHLRHQVGAGRRSSHYHTIPLCPRHHLGHGYGVSFHDGKVAWEKRFGTELQLLEQVRSLL